MFIHSSLFLQNVNVNKNEYVQKIQIKSNLTKKNPVKNRTYTKQFLTKNNNNNKSKLRTCEFYARKNQVNLINKHLNT